MYRLVTTTFAGRHVLIVEDDEHVAALVSSSIVGSGGVVSGLASTVEQAVEVARTSAADTVVIDVRQVGHFGFPIGDLFRPSGIEIHWLTGFDDWFDPDVGEWEDLSGGPPDGPLSSRAAPT